MNDLMNNNYIVVLVALFISLYGLNLAKTKLPNYIKNLFTNPIFNTVFLSLLLVLNFDSTPHVALVIALVFVLTSEYISHNEIKENMAYYENYRSIQSN